MHRTSSPQPNAWPVGVALLSKSEIASSKKACHQRHAKRSKKIKGRICFCVTSAMLGSLWQYEENQNSSADIVPKVRCSLRKMQVISK